MNRDWREYEYDEEGNRIELEPEAPQPKAEKPLESAASTAGKILPFRRPWRTGERRVDDGWFIRDLAERPDMIAKWKKMSTATHNTVGYPLTEAQRKFAAGILRQVEDWTGTAL